MPKAKTELVTVRGAEIRPGDVLSGMTVETANRGVLTYEGRPHVRAEIAPTGPYVVERRVVSPKRPRRSRTNLSDVRGSNGESGES